MAKKETDVGKKSEYYVEFSKPYVFEGEEYTGIDLSAVCDLGLKTLMEAERAWTMKGNASMQIEANLAYCIEVVAMATGKPFEFFEGLSAVSGGHCFI